jgi:glycosyltransferase involved in cell wall biosynthesis
MKIGLVIEYFKPHALGGAERSAGELAHALAERGHAVAILTPNYGAPSEEDDGGGVRIHRYWFPKRVAPGRMAPLRWSVNPLYYWYSGHLIGRLARRLELDILHAQNTFVQVPTYYAARRLGLPCVATLRDVGSLCSIGHLISAGRDPDHVCANEYGRCRREFMARYYPNAPAWFRARLRLDTFLKHRDLVRRQRILVRYSKIIFVSHGLRAEYLRHGFPVPADRLTVAYNIPPLAEAVERAAGPLPAEWNIPDGAPVVAYAGKLSLGKGAHVLFQAIPHVLERHPDAVFVFAGRLTPQVRPPVLLPARNIRVLGRIAPEEVHRLLARSSLFVLPSIWPEPLSSAVLEAMAFGVPVVATATGGTPEQIIDGETGRLVAPGDPAALADAIATLLADEPARRRMSERARALLRDRFDRDRIVDQMLSIYDSAIRPTGHP